MKTLSIIGWMAVIPVFAAMTGSVPAPQKESSGPSAWVKKSAEAKSCEGEGEPSTLARKELEKGGVQVLEAVTGGDGLMHLQMCGADTGKQHYFRIPQADVAKAKGLGFSDAPGFDRKKLTE